MTVTTTTVRLDDELLRQAKEYSARCGRTLTSVLEESLRRTLAQHVPAHRAERVRLPVSTAAGGLQPGVDLDDSAALLELMDNTPGHSSDAAS